MAAEAESAIAGSRLHRAGRPHRHAQRRGVELFVVPRCDDVLACGWRRLRGIDLTLLRLYRLRSVARARPVRSERAWENELRIRRRSCGGRDIAARAYDVAVAVRRIL